MSCCCCCHVLQVYVAAAKRSIMSCLDLPPHLAALLTTNHLEANIHAVSWHSSSIHSQCMAASAWWHTGALQ